MKTKLSRIQYFLCWVVLLATALQAATQTVAPRALPATTEKKLRELLAEPVVQQAHVGLSIMALGTAKTPQDFPSQPYTEQQRTMLFEVDGGKRFMSASNTKLYTAAIALKVLGPEKKFVTRLALDGDVKNGTLEGSLVLIGGGDPSLSYEDLRAFARNIAASRIKRVWAIITDESLINAETFGGRYPDGWTLDDTLWYYGAEISALTINRNQSDVTIEGAAVAGQPAKVTFDPPLPADMIQVQVKTGNAELAKKSASEFISYDRSGVFDPITSQLKITGTVAPGQKLTEGIAIPNPSRWAGFLLRQALKENGIEVTGVPKGKALRRISGKSRIEHHSAPLSDLLRRLLKNSDNLYAEVLLRNAGLNIPSAAEENANVQQGTAAPAHRALFDWLRENHVDTTGLRFTDGSGLSRYNMITPRATAQLLAAVDAMPNGTAIWEALPIAGVDGTLKNRMRSTPAANNVRAKTGTFSIVSTLSGYVTTRDGHRLAVSLLTNFAPDGTAVRDWQDKAYALLAEADWSTPVAN